MNDIKKELGKIKSVTFGHGGYQDACIGINLTLGGDGDIGWGVGTDMTAWDSNMIKVDDHTKWTEEDRDRQYANIMRYVSDLLAQAKVSDITKLQGIPIEAEFEGMTLKSWRILTEVL